MDSPVPSANSVLALELQRLALIFQDQKYEDAALGGAPTMRNAMRQAPTAFAHLLAAVDFYTSDAPEIVIIGPQHDPGTSSLLQVARGRFRPNKVLVLTQESSGLERDVPLVQDRPMKNGKSTAYVCRHGACQQPVDSAEDLLAQLSA
jgi:uncharacterized protein YyaL (SSP411 family)